MVDIVLTAYIIIIMAFSYVTYDIHDKTNIPPNFKPQWAIINWPYHIFIFLIRKQGLRFFYDAEDYQDPTNSQNNSWIKLAKPDNGNTISFMKWMEKTELAIQALKK